MRYNATLEIKPVFIAAAAWLVDPSVNIPANRGQSGLISNGDKHLIQFIQKHHLTSPPHLTRELCSPQIPVFIQLHKILTQYNLLAGTECDARTDMQLDHLGSQVMVDVKCQLKWVLIGHSSRNSDTVLKTAYIFIGLYCRYRLSTFYILYQVLHLLNEQITPIVHSSNTIPFFISVKAKTL